MCIFLLIIKFNVTLVCWFGIIVLSFVCHWFLLLGNLVSPFHFRLLIGHIAVDDSEKGGRGGGLSWLYF